MIERHNSSSSQKKGENETRNRNSVKIQSNSVSIRTDKFTSLQHFQCAPLMDTRRIFRSIWQCVIFTIYAIVLRFYSHFPSYVSIKLNSDAMVFLFAFSGFEWMKTAQVFLWCYFSKEECDFFYDLHTVLWEIALKPVLYHSIPTNDPHHLDSFIASTVLWDKITSTRFIMYQNAQRRSAVRCFVRSFVRSFARMVVGLVRRRNHHRFVFKI